MATERPEAGPAPSLATLLELEPLGGDAFLAPPSPERRGRLYGGQLLAQGLLAATHTVDAPRAPHSLHGYFLRAGAVDAPLRVEVERTRDGRSFSARAARVLQDGRELFRLLASYQVPEPGPAFTARAMPPVPAPDAVGMTYNEFSRRAGEGEDWDGEARPMELRYVNPPDPAPGEPVLEDQRVWMRSAGRLPDDDTLHAAGLAYLADSTLIDHAALPHGRRWQEPALNGASLDHAMWFHRPARADAWLLFDQSVEATGGGRGFVTGRIYTADGALVATCAQEGVLRWS